ncbi:LAFE_0H00430g1_1 [Lachancea fermentati]|uniref:LAFE_0H00430g1_1 n=1 Tax=Lachancea fermentati TaxID=4955 RepID=A0A1G4MJ44_LACFM|nr:LAFE_0H00430g1_1 [Lachancea fermentati]
MSYRHFLKSLGLQIPIIQAPMAGICDAKLVAAVCNNGALASLPISHIDFTSSNGIGELRSLISEVNGLIDNKAYERNINLNFFCHDVVIDVPAEEKENWYNLYERVSSVKIPRGDSLFNKRGVSFKDFENGKPFDDLLSFFKHEFTPKVLSFHFGYPQSTSIKAFQDLGIKVFVTATSAEEFRLLNELGVDGIICQGYEAGGHRGNFLQPELFDEKLSTACLIKRTIPLVNMDEKNCTFVIPAGGLNSPEDVKYMLNLGVSAVQVGTAFLTTAECKVASKFNRILSSVDIPEPTIMTNLVSGKHARAISSPFLRRLTDVYHDEALPDYSYMYGAFKSMKEKYPKELQFVLAGQNYGSIKTNLTVGQLLDNFARGL